MDWTQTFTILGVMIGGFLYLLSKIDSKCDSLSKEIQGIDRRIQRIEDRLEYSNKVVYVQHDQAKEN